MVLLLSPTPMVAQDAASVLPDEPLVFGAFVGTFSPDGSFSIEGEGWPELSGQFQLSGEEMTVAFNEGSAAPEGCEQPGRYRFSVEGRRLSLRLVEDACRPRQMILGASDWRPADQPREIPERQIRIERKSGATVPDATSADGSWPGFRGSAASGVVDGMNLPERFDAESEEHVVWRAEIEGLAHSSPVVWGERLFLTSAVSSRESASFRPGLYGDGDAADDRSKHSFVVLALDKRTGRRAVAPGCGRGRTARQAAYQGHLCQRLSSDRWPRGGGVVRIARAVRVHRRPASRSGRSISAG